MPKNSSRLNTNRKTKKCRFNYTDGKLNMYQHLRNL